MSSSSYSSSFDSDKYKNNQRKSWDMVAEGWQKWWKTFEQDAQKVNERLVELAEIKQGDKVLDIATGIGEPAITAARKVGIKGHVLATDISPQMLNIAKQRAVSFRLKDIIEFKEIDAERIDIDLQLLLPQYSSFNAVLCRWGLMFFPNLISEAIIAPIQEILANEPETRREKIWKALTEDVKRKYVTANNSKSIRMDNETICIVGRKS